MKVANIYTKEVYECTDLKGTQIIDGEVFVRVTNNQGRSSLIKRDAILPVIENEYIHKSGTQLNS